jgi:hypothetical protein
MRRPVADDVIAVLEIIKAKSSGHLAAHDLRLEATQKIAETELNEGRFKNEISAETTISDACVRRLGYTGVEEFDLDVDKWLKGQPNGLEKAVFAKITREDQRRKLAAIGFRESGIQELPALTEEEFEEARKRFGWHRIIEREPRSVRKKKNLVLGETGRLACEVCDFDFLQFYGALGNGFAECHHRTPLADLEENHRTILSELAIVCANCHRMLHRRCRRETSGRRFMSVPELRQLVQSQGSQRH